MSAGITMGGFETACPHCGGLHKTTCPRISAIEYGEDGKIVRIEFHDPQPVVSADAQWWKATVINGPREKT